MVDENVPVVSAAQADRNARATILTALYKTMQRSHDLDDTVLEIAVRATCAMSLKQLGAAATYVATNPPKLGTPIPAALIQANDMLSSGRERLEEQRGLMVVPHIPGATPNEVQKFARPSGYQWKPDELQLISDVIFGQRKETWLAKQRRLYPPLELDPAVYGPPPDPNDDSPITRERSQQLWRQLQAKLAHLEKIGAGPKRKVFGIPSIGEAFKKEVDKKAREPGEEG